jgi:hypothetical protein
MYNKIIVRSSKYHAQKRQTTKPKIGGCPSEIEGVHVPAVRRTQVPGVRPAKLLETGPIAILVPLCFVLYSGPIMPELFPALDGSFLYWGRFLPLGGFQGLDPPTAGPKLEWTDDSSSEYSSDVRPDKHRRTLSPCASKCWGWLPRRPLWRGGGGGHYQGGPSKGCCPPRGGRVQEKGGRSYSGPWVRGVQPRGGAVRAWGRIARPSSTHNAGGYSLNNKMGGPIGGRGSSGAGDARAARAIGFMKIVLAGRPEVL